MLRVFQELRQDKRPEHVRAVLLALMQRSLLSPEPAYRRQADRMVVEGCETVAVVHNSANTAQRHHIADRLERYEADFRALIAQR